LTVREGAPSDKDAALIEKSQQHEDVYFSSINYPSKKIEREQQDIQYEKSVEKRAVPMVSKNFDSPSTTIRTN
jgi:hypothetical protein